MTYNASVFIATPAYEGKVHVQYAISLSETCTALYLNNINPIIKIPTCGSLLVADRNRLLELFWRSGAEYMLCIDSDIGWNHQDVLRMLCYNKDFVAGVYPSRDGINFTFRPALNADGSIAMCPDTKLLKMEYIPAGFMLIKRSVIAKLRADYEHLKFSPKHSTNEDDSGYCIFDTEVYEGEFWGEDYVFCRRVRQSGFDIFVDPSIEFDHAGIKGSLVQALEFKVS